MATTEIRSHLESLTHPLSSQEGLMTDGVDSNSGKNAWECDNIWRLLKSNDTKCSYAAITFHFCDSKS